ncbi:MAG: protein-export chaperone SecB [Rhodospirillaceae bacterium]
MNDAPKESGTDSQPVSSVQFVGQFIKDLSFEVPHAPEIFNEMRETAPDIPISVDCETRELKENTHEVSINIHVEATIGDKPAFILEVAYVGIVILGEIPKDHVRPVLLIEVPRQMFPFVRQVVADTTVQGGFPPLMLQLIDFMDLYRRKYSTEDELAREAKDMTTVPNSPAAE